MSDKRVLTLEPIGVVRSPFTEKMQAPRQPGVPEAADGSVQLYSGRDFEHALEDLSTFRFIWLLFWFDRAVGWRPKVLPPRSTQRRGVFATRSPHRPNPIGMSLVELSGIDGLTLSLKGIDLLDGTPVLDIKPYIPYADSRVGAGHGWLDEQVIPKDPLQAFEVLFSEQAQAELAILSGFQVELEPAIRQVLELGPEPHPYRRIRKVGTGGVLALKDYRVLFTAEGRRITVQAISSGYRPKQLATMTDEGLAPHRALAESSRGRL